MKRCLAMILTCALLLTVCPLEGLAAELEQKKQEAEADYIEQPIGEVEFQEEAPSPNQPEEPEEAPPEEPKAEPTTPEHEEVPKENAVQVQSADTYTEGGYTYTVADGVATITKYTGSATTLTIPETLGGYVVNKIGRHAFARCANLSKVLIPTSVKNFEDNIFLDTNRVTIYCDYNSYATLYAISNKIPFQASGGFVGSEDSILNWNNSRYYADTNGISSNGYINMSVNYQVKDAWKDQVHDLVVKVNLPSTAELSEKTIRVDGVLCTN